MTARLILAAAAETDLASAVAWYDKQAPGLGDSFIEIVEEVFDGLRLFPNRHQVVFENVRRAILRRFPYSVVYRIHVTSIEIVGILPCRSDPQILSERAATPMAMQ